MTARTIPPELLDYSKWPTVTADGMSPEDRQRYLALKGAVEAKCDGKMASWISAKWGIPRSTVHYHLARCILRHPDGRVNGYRALTYGFRVAGYTRVSSVQPSCDGSGLAGAFELMLREEEGIEAWLRNEVKRSHNGRAYKEAGLNLAALHGQLLERLRKAGRTPQQYPFCTAKGGYVSLCAYVKRLVSSDDAAALSKFGDQAGDGLAGRSNKSSLLSPLASYERCGYDEYMLPDICTLVVEVDGAEIDLPLSRAHFCPIVDFESAGVLGYSVAVSLRFRALDLLTAFECAINPPAPQAIPGLGDLAQGVANAGLPAAAVPGAKGRRICHLVVDNHLTHLANSVVGHLRRRTGIGISFGQVRRWITRAVVEGVFAGLQQQLSRIASTTGSGPHDPIVNDPVHKAIRHRIRLDDLLAVLDAIVRRYNALGQRRLMMRSPNEVIALSCSSSHRLSIIPAYDAEFLKRPWLAVEIELATVRGSRKRGARPYVEFDGGEYTNDILSQSWHLIGSQLECHIKGDFRSITAFRLDGTEFGVLQVSGHWANSPHNRETRKEIQRLYREGLLTERGKDPVSLYHAHLARTALAENKRKGGKITAAASKLALSLKGTQTPRTEHGPRFELADASDPEVQLPARPRGRRGFFIRPEEEQS